MSEGNGHTNGNTQPPSDGDLNIQLMRAMGSPIGSDPIPPSQYLYFLEDPNGEQKALAWMRSKTIRLGHRKHYAADRQGKALTIQHLANDCFDKDWSNANRAFEGLRAKKLVDKDLEGRLLLCGNVLPRSSRQATETKPIGKRLPVCTNWSDFCTNWSPPTYLREQVECLPEPERDSLAQEYSAFLGWADGVEADAITAARRVVEEREKIFLAKRGIEKRTLEKQTKRKSSVQLTLVLDFSVQTEGVQANDGSAHTENETSYNRKNGSYKVEKKSVQSSPPIGSLKSSEDRGNTSEEQQQQDAPSQSVSPTEKDRPTDRVAADPAERMEAFLLEPIPSGTRAPARSLHEKLPDELPGRPLCQKIVNALGTAPWELLGFRIHKRWDAITSFGIVLELAKDVREAWDKGAAERRKLEVISVTYGVQREAGFIAMLQEMYNDPRTEPEDREKVAEQLKAYGVAVDETPDRGGP